MMRAFFLRGLSLSAIVALLAMPVPVTEAQEEAALKPEVIELMVGDILELLPAHTLPNPVYTWILTQDRTFIQAGRAPNFRWRPIQTNIYTLIAELQSGDGTQRIRRTFSIDVKARPAGQEGDSLPENTSDNIVATVPTPDANGRVILPEHHLVMRLNTLEQEGAAIALDLDANVDSDADGITTNDVNNEGTFFQSEGTPLHVWFASPLTTADLNLTTLDTEGAAIQQRIQVASYDYAMEQGLIISPVSISMQPIGGREYSFTGKLETPLTTPLLYHWTFGDGQESLLMNPTHTFAENGAYTIQLRVRNLLNGKEVAMQEQQISVQEAGPVTDTGSAVSSEPDTSNGDGFFSARAGSILIMVGIFVLFVLFGALGVWIFSKFLRRGKSLPETIATMEQTMLGTDKKAAPPLTITPAVTGKPSPTPEVVTQREQDRSTTNPVTQKPLTVDEATAPSWLKKGLVDTPKLAPTGAPVASATTPTATKAVAPTPAPVKPAPIPTPAPKPTTPAPTATPKPQVPTTPAASKPTQPASPATPVVAPAPTQPKAPTPTPNVATAPATPSGPVPAWMTPPAAPTAVLPATKTPVAPVTPPRPVVPAPVSPPKPATPTPPQVVAPAAPTPVPSKPVTPIVPSIPSPAPTSAAPLAATPPAPAKPVAAVPTVPPVQTPVTPPAPPTPVPPKPATPIPLSQTPNPAPSSDQPIAIIRADSLEKKPNGEQAQA